MKRGPKPRKLPAVVTQQIVARYRTGEKGMALCREYHIGYDRFRRILVAHSVEMQVKTRRTKDTREKCVRCGIVKEECEDWERALERDGLCGDCARFEDKDYGEGR